MREKFHLFTSGIFVLLLAACGNINEADEFKKLATVDLPQVAEKGKSLDINYYSYVQTGKLSFDELVVKVNDQIKLCRSIADEMDKAVYKNEVNQKVWRSFTASMQTDCKLKEASLMMTTTKDAVEREEAEKNADRLHQQKMNFFAEFKNSYSETCKKFDCWKYLKAQ